MLNYRIAFHSAIEARRSERIISDTRMVESGTPSHAFPCGNESICLLFMVELIIMTFYNYGIVIVHVRS